MGLVAYIDVESRRQQADEVYQKKSKLLSHEPERLEKLNKDYALLMQILGLYSQGMLKKDIAAAVGIRQQKVSGWLSREFPRSFRITGSRRKKLDVKTFEKSLDFFYLLGTYQPRVKKIDPKRISIESKDSWLEKKICDCLFNVFGDSMKSKKTLYESRYLMDYVKEITDDNTNLPRSLKGIIKYEAAYLNGLFDSRACISSYNYKVPGWSLERKRPIIFIHVTNECLIEKIRALLLWHGVRSSYITDKRDGKRCIAINEFNSLKKCLKYFSKDSAKKEKLSELIAYVKEHKLNDLHGLYSKMRSKVLKEKMLQSQPNTFKKKFYKKEYKLYY